MYPDFELFTHQDEMLWRNPGMHHTSSRQEHVENDPVCKHGHSPRTGGLKLLTHLVWLPESHEQYYSHCPFPNCAGDASYLRRWRGFTLKSHIHKPLCPAALNSSNRWQEKLRPLRRKIGPEELFFYPPPGKDIIQWVYPLRILRITSMHRCIWPEVFHLKAHCGCVCKYLACSIKPLRISST